MASSPSRARSHQSRQQSVSACSSSLSSSWAQSSSPSPTPSSRRAWSPEVARLVPPACPAYASAAGGIAEPVRALLPPGSPELDGLLLALSNSVDKAFYLLLSAGIAVCGSSFGMGWVDLRKKKMVVENEGEK